MMVRFIKLELIDDKYGVDLADINVDLNINHLVDVDIGTYTKKALKALPIDRHN